MSESCFQEGPSLTHQQPLGQAHRGQASQNRTRRPPPAPGRLHPALPSSLLHSHSPIAPNALCPAGLTAQTTSRVWMLVCAHVQVSVNVHAEEGTGMDWVLTLHGMRAPGRPSGALPRGGWAPPRTGSRKRLGDKQQAEGNCESLA